MKSLNLLSFRSEHGITQVQLAEMLDITAEYVSMIENGKKPLSKKLLKKFGLLESSLTFNRSTDPPKEKQLSCSVPCPECARLMVENARLNQIIDKLVSK